MIGYWFRHRLLGSLIISCVVALIAGYLFAFSYISKKAERYNEQSIYKNTEIDFIAPEPSFDQISTLPGTNGIEKVFPYYLTKTDVSINGKKRLTTVLLSDKFENIDITMYNPKRVIKNSNLTYSNPIYVDWQFCKDTSANIGDTISFSVDGKNLEFTIAAIYETNTIYEGGAILGQISKEQKDSIDAKSCNNGYSGMYISSSEYGTCQAFLSSEYRPLGRLQDRVLFENEEQYQVHYDAIMSSGYANEITNFRIRENSIKQKDSAILLIIGAILSLIIMFTYSIVMSRRGCEKVYFLKHCIPKGTNVKPYYIISFVSETFIFLVGYIVTIIASANMSEDYIPIAVYDFKLAIIPIALIIAEIISFIYNCAFIANDKHVS